MRTVTIAAGIVVTATTAAIIGTVRVGGSSVGIIIHSDTGRQPVTAAAIPVVERSITVIVCAVIAAHIEIAHLGVHSRIILGVHYYDAAATIRIVETVPVVIAVPAVVPATITVPGIVKTIVPGIIKTVETKAETKSGAAIISPVVPVIIEHAPA